MSPLIHDRIPVTLLTGFLGAGKTTVLNHLLSQPEMARAAVLINEFGEVAVDHHLVSKIDDDLILLDSGCICCSVRGDLTRSLDTLFRRSLSREIPPIERVLIETTGLADPAPVVFTLMEDFFIADRFCVDGVVTVVDAMHSLDQLELQPEPLRQVAMADRLLVSKCDQVTPEQLLRVRETLSQLNPAARQIEIRDGQVAPAELMDCGVYDPRGKVPDVAAWLGEEKQRAQRKPALAYRARGGKRSAPAPSPAPTRHMEGVYSFTLTFDTPLEWMAFSDALQFIVDTMGHRILRIKGLVSMAGAVVPYVIQCVHHVVYPPVRLAHWPDTPPCNDRCSRLVFIVRGLQQANVEEVLASYCGVRDVHYAARQEALQ